MKIIEKNMKLNIQNTMTIIKKIKTINKTKNTSTNNTAYNTKTITSERKVTKTHVALRTSTKKHKLNR